MPPAECLSGTTRSALRTLEGRFVRPHRRTLFLAMLGMLVQSLLGLPAPLIQGAVVDRLVALVPRGSTHLVAAPAYVTGRLALAVGITIACHLGRMVLGWLVATSTTRVTLEVVRELTDALHRKLQRMGMPYFDGRSTGQIMSRITSDVGSLLLYLSGGSLQLLADLVPTVGIAVLLFTIQLRLAIVGLAVLPLYAVIHRLFQARLLTVSRRQREEAASLFGLLSERITAVRVVRSFAKEDCELAEFDLRLDSHRAVAWAGMKASSRQNSAATFLSGLGTVLVIGYGAVLVGEGRLTIGELLAFYGLITQLYSPIVRLAGFQSTLAGTAVAAERILDVLDEPEPTVEVQPPARLRRPKGALLYRDVSFSYGTGGRRVLDRIRLEVGPGMTLGILGPSGSGKSTLLALAPRLYELEPGRGAVLLDGRDVRGLDPTELRRAVALVPQRAMLFEGTIRSNVLYAAPSADDATVRRALDVADLTRFVAGLPMGLDTPVGERGQTLSGGQRQRLALARALVTDPAILLLDDCTSALDAETEARIQQALRELRPERTTLIVSHKASSMRDADRIVVLDRGRIVEEGTPDDLLEEEGRFAALVRSQTYPASSPFEIAV